VERKRIPPMIYPKFWFSPPGLLRKFYPEIIWKSAKKEVVVTIDDSPSDFSSKLLDILDLHKIHAMFFVKVEESVKHASVLREILSRGHKIGNHSITHRRLSTLNHDELKIEISSSKERLEDILGSGVKFFRPPYGSFNRAVLKEIKLSGQKCVMWDVLSGDYTSDLKIVKKNISRYLQSDSVTVFHDNKKSRNIFEESISFLMGQIFYLGYRVGEPAECLN